MRDETHNSSVQLLIVDDEPAVRDLLSHMLTKTGLSIRSAEDGFSALAEIRKDTPDIVLSDLNMPGMSGFELLTVIRRRFPAIGIIAMSGAFSGDEVPSGVIADAFYPKGSDIRCLMKIIGGLARPEQLPAKHPAPSVPLWIARNGNDANGAPYVTIKCPECLRIFSQPIDGALRLIRETHCVHCRSAICYAIVEPVDWVPVRRQSSCMHDFTPI
jgi:CheY-like chemotaxis protein